MEQNFTPPEWVKGSNIYEVNVRQYTPEGTLNAFVPHMPRLKAMGVETLWFMPLTPIGQVKRLGSLGSYYATRHYTQLNPEFGTEKDFNNLVKQAHKLGLRVMIDWVGNHTAWDHEWTKSNPEFYKRDTNGQFYDAHGWNDVIDLDYTNQKLRKTMIGCMKWWLTEFNIDGFRCDMAHLVPLDFWVKARTELSKVKNDLFWLAETEDVLYHLAFDATYTWELLHTMESMGRQQAKTDALDKVLRKYESTFPPGAIRLTFTSNHDENSHSGTEFERMGEGAKAFAIFAATYANSLLLVYSGQELPNRKRLLFFDKDQIDWGHHFWMEDFYKTLLKARRNNAALHAGGAHNTLTRLKTSADHNVFAFKRQSGASEVVVILNLSAQAMKDTTLTSGQVSGQYRSIFSGIAYAFEGELHFELQPWDYLVFEKIP